MADLSSVYSHLPHPLRALAATVRGYQLRWWRYGPETDSLIQEALQRESWTEGEWTAWREERVAYMLHHAATQVPYYRDYWQKQRAHSGKTPWSRLENWPILEKETVRANPGAFVADSSRGRPLFVDHTGGTTGKPTLIYESRQSVVAWYALLEARLRRWYGASYAENWAMFGGQQVVPLSRKSPPFWVANAGLHQLYCSVFHVKRETAADYMRALVRFQPAYMVVYPSIVGCLAQYILDQRLPVPRLKAIFCNSEKVLASHRSAMEVAFGCPVVDTYGMAEMTSAASECPAGNMHEWPEVGYLEVFDRGRNEFIRGGPAEGEFVMTGLLNDDMPLIRYANGDFGSVPDWQLTCACGRALPRFGRVRGRANDLIQAADGRRLYILDSLFNDLPILEAQFIQESLNRIRIRLVPAPVFRPQDHQVLTGRIREYLGSVEIAVDQVEAIPRDANGKFKPYISLMART